MRQEIKNHLYSKLKLDYSKFNLHKKKKFFLQFINIILINTIFLFYNSLIEIITEFIDLEIEIKDDIFPNFIDEIQRQYIMNVFSFKKNLLIY